MFPATAKPSRFKACGSPSRVPPAASARQRHGNFRRWAGEWCASIAILSALAGRPAPKAIDVADEASTIRAFKEAGAAWGGLDALVTAAGVIETTPFFETTVAQFRRLFDINVIGSFLSVREAAKHMQRGARICMIASISSYTGGGYVARGAYATSKGAVLTMMKSCARELGPKGIAVNAVAPGFIDTPFVASAMNDPVRRKEVEAAVGKVGTAEQIAECCAWLISPAADFVHGSTLIADGGILMR
jgi:NAD(P)-dependent dehydrogenase (short-subunit alcohol dehydrogenase family)